MATSASKKRSRGGIVGYINKLVKGDIAKIYADYKENDLTSLLTYKDVIEDKLKNILKLSEEIQDAMTDEEFTEDFDKYTDIEVTLRADLLKLANFISVKQKSPPTSTPFAPRDKSTGRVKLPRFEIKKFSGDLTKWKSFIESFDAARSRQF